MQRFPEAPSILDPTKKIAEDIRPKIALVLPPGGAWGASLIGVIRALGEYGFSVDESANHPIETVGGASMGALVLAFYLLGRLDEFENFLRLINTGTVRDYADVNLLGLSLLKGERFEDLLEDFFGEIKVDDLPIDYTCLATNWITRETIFSEKKDLLREVLRATCSVPLILPPAEFEDEIRLIRKLLIDGGFTNLVPVASVLHHYPDIVIGVDMDRRRGLIAETIRQRVMNKQFARDGRVPEAIIPVRLSHAPYRFDKCGEMIDQGYIDTIKWLRNGGFEFL